VHENVRDKIKNCTGDGSLATVNVFCAGAAQAVLTQIAEKFERDSDHKVNAQFGAVGAMKERVVAASRQT
jgi:ABC-type molybdate transport system substrate-binding protein